MFPWRSKNLYSILLTSLSAVMGVSLISPILPRIREILELTDLQTGAIITLYTLPAVVLAPLAGSLIDFYGRRAVLIPSLVLFGCSGFFVVFISSYGSLLSLRVAQGIGGTSLALISRTLIGDFFEDTTQQAVMGLNDATLSLGAAVFPLLGGFLGYFFWFAPFYLYVIPILVGLLSWFLLDRVSLGNDLETKSYLKSGLSKLSDARTATFLFLTFLCFFLLYGCIQTVSPLYLNDFHQYTSRTIGMYLTSMALVIAVVSVMNGRLSEHLDNSLLIFGGFGFYSSGLICLGGSGSSSVIMAGFLLFGAGHGLVLPSLNTQIVRLVATEQRGAIMAYRTVSARLGQTLGPIIFPLLGIILDYRELFVTTGGLLSGGVLVVLLLFNPPIG